MECLHRLHPRRNPPRNLSRIATWKMQAGLSPRSGRLSFVTLLALRSRISSDCSRGQLNRKTKNRAAELQTANFAPNVRGRPESWAVACNPWDPVICGYYYSIPYMPLGDIYVQVTASSGFSGKSRSVVVLVPRANIEKFRTENPDKSSDVQSVARVLAEPLARYAFTHRTIFSSFEVSDAILATAPREIEGRSPNLSQSGLKAWVLL